MNQDTHPSFEHPADVLAQIVEWQSAQEGCALIVVTHTQGGSVRAVGALMGVAAHTGMAGYVSGGCIDADVAAQARSSIKNGEVSVLRYGADSPFMDMKLPCGGTIEVLVLPNPDARTIQAASERLHSRHPLYFSVSRQGDVSIEAAPSPSGWLNDKFYCTYEPKMRLRVAGRGADFIALVKLAVASGYEVFAQSPAETDLRAAKNQGAAVADHLTSFPSLAASSDDPWTAFVLMFHDNDWETALIQHALTGSAFYIGAVGSRATHARRCDELRILGVSDAEIERIHGPIGLVPSLRNASSLAISTLAEIIDVFENQRGAIAERAAIILLSAGSSQRFANGDKLLAPLRGAPLIAHTAALATSAPYGARIAVIGPEQHERADILAAHGWQLVENPDAATGQATSLKAGINKIIDNPSIEYALILLADMPFVTPQHLHSLMKQVGPGATAVMSETAQALMPPAIFKRDAFDALLSTSGDKGARHIFQSLSDTTSLPIETAHALDIDHTSDLTQAEAYLNG